MSWEVIVAIGVSFRDRMRRVALGLGTIGCALAGATAPSSAQEVPRYDPEGWCKRVAESGGGSSEWLKDACLEQEQAAYDKLKPQWGTVPKKTRSWCNQVATSGGRGSYVLLEQCIDMEFASKQKNDNSKFKF
ncbi:hypothetical protein ACT6QG_05165 [Xanthobacter sp. TB0136]|uniref:hypothetical protein n=1 Tax=Xanthobacter sp. TB0136 TaxID=3459177 RepID=UPI004039F9A3